MERFCQPENCGKEGPPIEMDRFFRFDRSDRKLLFHSQKLRFPVTLGRQLLKISVQN